MMGVVWGRTAEPCNPQTLQAALNSGKKTLMTTSHNYELLIFQLQPSKPINEGLRIPPPSTADE